MEEITLVTVIVGIIVVCCSFYLWFVPEKGGRPGRHGHVIPDRYHTLEQCQDALREAGLETSELIVAIDFTKSNLWTGQKSFGGKSLHHISDEPNSLNPYEEALSIVTRTLAAFDEDQRIPCFGFGDALTRDKAVFSFEPDAEPCEGLSPLLQRYRELVPHLTMSGPTSFEPIIRTAMDIVASEGSYHILLIIADGLVTDERGTMQAIVDACKLPLSIVVIGVGDGPFDLMEKFDDRIPERPFDNFQFVDMKRVLDNPKHQKNREAAFAMSALMEVPEQFRKIRELGLMNMSRHQTRIRVPDCLAPPDGKTASGGKRKGGGARAKKVQNTRKTMGAGAGASPGMQPEFMCPITQDLMTDPVVCADGQTYERSAIEQWFQNHDTSPLTNATLPSKQLQPNYSIKSQIDRFHTSLKTAPSASSCDT